jgi:ABC-2 type transport system ATP-binding protein
VAREWGHAGQGPGTRRFWRTAECRDRNIRNAPAGAKLVEPSIEDGYLLLVGEAAFEEAA